MSNPYSGANNYMMDQMNMGYAKRSPNRLVMRAPVTPKNMFRSRSAAGLAGRSKNGWKYFSMPTFFKRNTGRPENEEEIDEIGEKRVDGHHDNEFDKRGAGHMHTGEGEGALPMAPPAGL